MRGLCGMGSLGGRLRPKRLGPESEADVESALLLGAYLRVWGSLPLGLRRWRLDRVAG